MGLMVDMHALHRSTIMRVELGMGMEKLYSLKLYDIIYIIYT